MGHLRTGSLPRTKKWSDVVLAVGAISGVSDSSYLEIAEKTLDASNQSLRQLPGDLALQKCFQFLVALSVAGKSALTEHFTFKYLNLVIQLTPVSEKQKKC